MHHSIIWYFSCFLCAKSQTLIIVKTRAQHAQHLLQQLANMSNTEDTEAPAAQVPANPAAPQTGSPDCSSSPNRSSGTSSSSCQTHLCPSTRSKQHCVRLLEHTQDVKLYYKAMPPLTREDRFDGTPEKIVMFFATVQDWALNFGWSDILTIPDNNGVNHNIIQEYGHLTMLNMTTHAAANIGQLTCQAQNAQMLYHLSSNHSPTLSRAKFSCIKVTPLCSSSRYYHLPTLTQEPLPSTYKTP